jgi:DNA processing protein
MALADLGRRGTRVWAELAARLGGARAVFHSQPRTLAELGGSAAASAVEAYTGWAGLQLSRRRARELGLSIATLASPEYPANLRSISDPPLILYYCGAEPAELQPAVAVVGSRRASRYGKRIATAIARQLAAAGATVVSGLAVGVDTAAHEGALAVGRSIGVLAGGIDRIYPSGNGRLARELAERGALLTEYPPGTPTLAHHFPIRNRIITGLASVTVVVEGAVRSGSLVSARLAAEQGREVFAVPGNIDSETSAGTNRLIRDGCAPLLEAADVLEVLGLAPIASGSAAGAPNEAAVAALGDPQAARILGLLDDTPTHPDELALACGLDGARILELLTALELEGLAERCSGGRFARRAAVESAGGRARRIGK